MTERTCWLCGERDNVERLESEVKGKRTRYAHLGCKEEAFFLVRDYLEYESKKEVS